MKFMSDKAPKPVGAYPHARKEGNLLFLSGVGPRNKNSNEIPGVDLDKDGNVISHDIEVQCHAVFNNIRIILEESGSKWDNLVDVTVFLMDMEKDFDTHNRLYADNFKSTQPWRPTVGVMSLPTPVAIELKCIPPID